VSGPLVGVTAGVAPYEPVVVGSRAHEVSAVANGSSSDTPSVPLEFADEALPVAPSGDLGCSVDLQEVEGGGGQV